jgi:glycosyltransferase involved in cell wall biosynthesis
MGAGSIVLAMITKNSVEDHGAVFEKTLTSTLQVPYTSIILVDDSTTDKTRRVVESFARKNNKELLVLNSRDITRFRHDYYFERPTRAVARQTAIEAFLQNFGEDWLFFVDDDVVLNPGWWAWVQANGLGPKVGEVLGLINDYDQSTKNLLESFGINYVNYLIRMFYIRGGTLDTMYRRGAIEGVVIPWDFHVYEDAWLHHYVNCRGWDSLVNPVGAVHFGEVGYWGGKLLFVVDSLVYMRFGFPPWFVRAMVRAYGFRRGLQVSFKRGYVMAWFCHRFTRREVPYPCFIVLGSSMHTL